MIFKWKFLLCVTTLIAGSLAIIPRGTKQIYQYKYEINSNDLKQTKIKNFGYTIKNSLAVSSVWNSDKIQLYRFELESSEVSVNGKGPKKQYFSNTPKIIFYMAVKDNKALDFIAQDEDDTSLQNLKRSIASLFLFNFEEGRFIEKTSSGTCSGFYSAKSSTKYTKTILDCSNWDLKVHHRNEPSLGVVSNSLQDINYGFSQDSVLLSIESLETHSVSIKSKPDVGSKIESRLNLLQKSSDNVEQLNISNVEEFVESLDGFKVIELEAEIDGRVNTIQDGMAKLIDGSKTDFSQEFIGQEVSAVLLLKLLPTARITKMSEFKKLLKLHSNENTLGTLIDLLAATQTKDSHNAFFEHFNYNNNRDFDNIERYLQSLAVGTRASKEIILDLVNKTIDPDLNNDKLKDTIVQTIAALTSHYARLSSKGYDDPTVHKIKKFIVESCDECKTSECKEIYIRGLQNLRDVSTIPILVKFALVDEIKCSVTAMKALQVFPVESYTEIERRNFEKIFFEIPKKFDSSARTLALDILFKLKPNKQQLTELLSYLHSNDSQYEVKTYLIQKLRMVSESCPRFNALFIDVLHSMPNVNNYNIIGQKGLTTALRRQISKAPAFNESLLSIQEIYNGVLKRGSVDLLLRAGNEEQSTFKLGIFTGGLSSFVGDSDSDDSGSPTAGMEITLQNVNFRPLVFFNSQSELMGHVWSGTASDPTPAYQATTLMQDHEQYIILQNGETVYIRINGARSIDLNGKVDFSLWNRNANTEINQNSGMAVVGLMAVRSPFVIMRNDFTLTSEPKISLVANIDFYSDILLCIQLSVPDMSLRYVNEQTLELRGEKKFSKNISNRNSHTIRGTTLALNQKNNEMCNKIFS